VSAFAPRKKGTGIVRCRACSTKLDNSSVALADKGLVGEVWEDGTGQRYIGGDDTTMVAVPGVLKYLDVELAAMGIKLKYNVEP
jgi:DNA-directed RNA polymerase I subunit RPA2